MKRILNATIITLKKYRCVFAFIAIYTGATSTSWASPFPSRSYIHITTPDTSTQHETWIALDSLRILNPLTFYSAQETQPETTAVSRIENININGFYACILVMLVLLTFYARLFKLSFLNQFQAFFKRSEMGAYLISDEDTLESEKIFPFLITWLFLATFVCLPILKEYAYSSISLSILIISGISLFAIITLTATFFRTLFSYTLDFKEINNVFGKASFNTLFNLAIWGTLMILLYYMVFPETPFLSAHNAVQITGIMYLIRTIKSVGICLNQELRQIIYLFIYLCTFEIPLILAGFKLIKDSVMI